MPSRARRLGLIVVASAWWLALVTPFFWNRGDDAGRLPALLRGALASLIKGPVFGTSGLAASAGGLLIAGLLVLAWWGLGDLIMRATPRRDAPHRALDGASRCVFGAAVWSIVWFGLGAAHLYRGWVAVAALGVGLALAVLGYLRDRHRPAPRRACAASATACVAFALIAVAQALALVAALAPPTARDTLFYHFALPKAYIAGGGLVAVPYNMASFYPQGVEMQAVWAMLLGSLAGARVAETAAGAAVFAFAPLLLLAIYGWARERGADRAWASISALMFAAIPTAYDVAGSGYVDLALAAYTALAVHAVGRWWTTLDRAWIAPVAVAVAGALSVKLTAGFLILPLALLALVRAFGAGRDSRELDSGLPGAAPQSAVLAGVGALALGALLASPWYVRTWVRTGSPLFPFYLNVWPGAAPGWDPERAQLYQTLLSLYGDARTAWDYVLTPVRLAVTAQPDHPGHYDGVLGIAFLFGLPLLLWALWRRRLAVELRVATLVSAVLFVLWLCSSQQMRFLLPALPGFAVAMAAAGTGAAQESVVPGRVLRWLLLGAAAAGLPVILAWFAELDPVRVVLGGEPRGTYLERRLDYYPYYELINREAPPTVRVWLINMRRDTYHLDRPYFSDFVFEDYTLTQHVRAAASADEIRARVQAAGITHLLVRHDLLFDYARSPIVDDRATREQNLAKLELLAAFFKNGTRLIRGDPKFWLIELPRPGAEPPRPPGVLEFRLRS